MRTTGGKSHTGPGNRGPRLGMIKKVTGVTAQPCRDLAHERGNLCSLRRGHEMVAVRPAPALLAETSGGALGLPTVELVKVAFVVAELGHRVLDLVEADFRLREVPQQLRHQFF